MISLSQAEITQREQECTHKRSITCLPGSGSSYFCDDCGFYIPFRPREKVDMTNVHVGRWKDHIIGPTNARKLW